jgi:iron complex outermembrane receptor protein
VFFFCFFITRKVTGSYRIGIPSKGALAHFLTQGHKMYTLRHHGPIITLFILLELFFSASLLWGDTPRNTFSENYFYDELPIVLSVSRLAQSQADTPSAISVIDRKMIEASAALNIPELLRLIPGFSIGFYSGTRATVTYHGHADEYARDMQVLVDGRSIYDPVYGGIPWTEISLSLDDILRIEVIRGPNAAAYGSNAYAGVINIVTNRPDDYSGTSISSTVGYQHTRYIEAAHADQQGDLNYRLSTSYRKDDGFRHRDDATRVKWLKMDSNYHINTNNTIRTILGTSAGDYDEGYPKTLQRDRELDTHYNYQSIEWHHLLDPNNHINVHLYHNYYKVNDLYHTPTFSENIMALDELQDIDESQRLDMFAMAISNDRYNFNSLLDALNLSDDPLVFSWIGLKSHRYDLEFEHTLEPFNEMRIAWGLGARQDRGESPWLLGQDHPISRNLYRFFFNTEWYITKQTIVNAGTTLEKFKGKKRLFSPRLGLNYHITPENTIRVSGSRAYRMPTLFEDNVSVSVYLGTSDNPIRDWIYSSQELEPQRIDRIEAGYFGQFSDHGLNYDLCLFREEYTNIIDQYRNFDHDPYPNRGITDPQDKDILRELLGDTERGAFTLTNYGTVEINGIEFELDFRPSRQDLLYFGFSYLEVHGNEIKRLKGGVYSYRDNADKKIPKRTFSLLASHRFDDGMIMGAAYYFTDEMAWPGEGDSVPNYSRVDIKFNKKIIIEGSKIDIALIFQNLHKDNYDFYHNEEIDEHNIWELRSYLQTKITF